MSTFVHNTILKGGWKSNDWKWQNSLTCVRFHPSISNVYAIFTVGCHSLCLLQVQKALQMSEKSYRTGGVWEGRVHGVLLGPSGVSICSLQASSTFHFFPAAFSQHRAEGMLDRVRGHSPWTEVPGSELDPSPQWSKGSLSPTMEGSMQGRMDGLDSAWPHPSSGSKHCPKNVPQTALSSLVYWLIYEMKIKMDT